MDKRESWSCSPTTRGVITTPYPQGKSQREGAYFKELKVRQYHLNLLRPTYHLTTTANQAHPTKQRKVAISRINSV